MKQFLFFISFLLITACKTAREDTPPQAFSPGSATGLIVGSITFTGNEKPANDIYRFFYGPVTTDKKLLRKNSGKITIKAREGNIRGYTGDFNNKKTYLFIIEREPGNYHFNQYNYLDQIGYAGMVTSSNYFSIPFTISAGTINYIGELSYNDIAIQGQPRIIISPNFERDMQELRKKFPSINWDAAINNPAKSGNTGNGLIEFR